MIKYKTLAPNKDTIQEGDLSPLGYFVPHDSPRIGELLIDGTEYWRRPYCTICEDKPEDSGIKEEPTEPVKAQGQNEPYPDSMKRGPLRELWDFFCDEHGLNPTDTELHDIVDAVAKYQRDLIGEQARRDADSVPSALTKSDNASVNPKPASVSSEAASVKPETIGMKIAQMLEAEGWLPSFPFVDETDYNCQAKRRCEDVAKLIDPMLPNSGWISFDVDKGGRKPTREDADEDGFIAVIGPRGRTAMRQWKNNYFADQLWKPLCYTPETPNGESK